MTKIKSAILNTGRSYKTPTLPSQKGQLQAIFYLNTFSDCPIRKKGGGCNKESELNTIRRANGTKAHITFLVLKLATFTIKSSKGKINKIRELLSLNPRR